MILTGTIVNSAAIVAGSIAGLLLGKFIPERFSDAMEKGAALCVLYIGVDGMLAGENTLVAILSIAIGAILGELLQLDEHMHQLGDWVERKFGGKGSKTSLSEGFVTASLLFCAFSYPYLPLSGCHRAGCVVPRAVSHRSGHPRDEVRRLDSHPRPIAQHAGPDEDQGDELRPCGVPADPIVPVSVSKKKRSIE